MNHFNEQFSYASLDNVGEEPSLLEWGENI
jgi:hypothetical protein